MWKQATKQTEQYEKRFFMLKLHKILRYLELNR